MRHPRSLSWARRATACVAVTLVIAACMAPVGPPPTASPGSGASTVSATPEVTASPEASDIAGAGPPVASLSAEGGDSIEAQLGTYVWGDTGSDSPWLPGARIAVGAGEPLTVRFRPPVAVASWRARFVPSNRRGPAGTRILGEGSGDPRFEAPDAGTWTIEVHVTFDNNAGNASYFWQLAVD